MSARLRALRALSGADRALLAEAWLTLLAVDVGLRVSSLARVQRAVAAAHRQGPPNLDAGARIEHVHRLVGMAARHHVTAMPCLRQALARQWLLGRRGIRTELRIGVRRDGERLLAHAWLEYAGQPVGEPEAVEEQFALLLSRGPEQAQ